MNPPPTVLQRRIVIGAAICVVAFAFVGARLVDVTLLKPSRVAAKPNEHVETVRDDLIDRNGELMARDLPASDLYVRPHLFRDKRHAAHILAAATGADEARLVQMFAGKHPYVLVARQLGQSTREQLTHLGLSGLEFQPNAKRYYPDGRLTSQVLGVTDSDDKGISGLELGLDPRLHRPGGVVQTSLDMRVQYILAYEAAASMAMFKARAAGGLVMDVHTGEIVALVSLPDFDPNVRSLDGQDTTRNIMAQDVYELGSVFKIFAFAQALEDHTVRLDEKLQIGDGYKIGKFTIHDAEQMAASLTARDVLALSSNIGTAQIALRSGGDRQRAFLTKMGLLAPVRSELPEFARPLYPAYWGTIETATISFGHGISVSPLAFAAAASAIVNGGRQVVPTFLKHTADARGPQLISPETSDEMRALLRYVVTDGSGRKADVPGYDIGGKTGSAEKAGPHGYQEHKLVTSFCAVFPIEAPRYLVFVVLDEPHGTKETSGNALAGYTAAPLAGHVISRIAPLLGVPLDPVSHSKENS